MIEEIRISPKDIDFIRSEMEINKPYEACGLLIGFIEKNVANIEKVYKVTNIKRTAVSFELDPLEYYKIWNKSEKDGKDVIGVYHSHPFYPAYPSNWDSKTMQNNKLIWLIVGVDGLRSYIWEDGIRNVNLDIRDDI